VRVVLQRVTWARVEVDGEEVAAIGAGLLALVGVARGDGPDDAALLARKTARARLFDGPERPFDTAVGDDPARGVLCVSQFTLHGDLRRGNRPSWSAAAAPEHAEPLVDAYVGELRGEGLPVHTGVFGAHMVVSLQNDGPVTLTLDSAELTAPRA